MRYSYTAVIERGAIVRGELATEPFEVGWADEARWFVKVRNLDDSTLEMRTEVSPDGLVWAPHEQPGTTVTRAGMATWPVREFGQWLRLRLVCEQEAAPEVMVYLVLKG
ncbi:MAG TPA: hypothetical protein VKV23_03660 [Acidimicrobiales bacterium]|nr:hypothetical protein [Acidimicrobiales bacterium]